MQEQVHEALKTAREGLCQFGLLMSNFDSLLNVIENAEQGTFRGNAATSHARIDGMKHLVDVLKKQAAVFTDIIEGLVLTFPDASVFELRGKEDELPTLATLHQDLQQIALHALIMQGHLGQIAFLPDSQQAKIMPGSALNHWHRWLDQLATTFATANRSLAYHISGPKQPNQ